MDISDALGKVAEHKWIAGGAVLLGIFLLSRGNSGGGAAADYSASLQSMAIASDTNVKIAEINAGRDVGMANAKAMVTLGSIDYAKTDRMSGMTTAIASIDANTNISQNTAMMSIAALQNILGYKAASKELDNQFYSLNSLNMTTFKDLDNQRELGVRSISAGRDVSLADISASRDLTLAGFQNIIEQLPFEVQMNQSNNNMITQLGHQQYKATKVAAKAGMLGQIISGGFSTFNNAMSMFGGK